MTGQRFEYQGRLVSVLELAELVLAGPVSAAVVEAAPVVLAAPPPPVVEPASEVIIPRKMKRQRRMSRARRLVWLWIRAIEVGLAICPSDRRKVKRGECLHCPLECVAQGLG